MDWVVIAAILIFGGCVVLGYARGFLKTIFSMLQMVLAIALVFMINPTVKDLLRDNTELYDQARSSIVSAIESQLAEGGLAAAPEMEETLIGQLVSSEFVQGLLKDNNTPEMYEALGVSSFADYVASYMADLIITALGFVVSFVVVLIGLQIVSLVFDLVGMLPVLGGVNRLAGALLGAVQGLLVLWVLFLLLTAFSDTQFGAEALQTINNNGILSLLYNNNLLLRLMIKIGMGI